MAPGVGPALFARSVPGRRRLCTPAAAAAAPPPPCVLPPCGASQRVPSLIACSAPAHHRQRGGGGLRAGGPAPRARQLTRDGGTVARTLPHGIEKGLMYSFPVTCTGGAWAIVQGLPIDDRQGWYIKKILKITIPAALCFLFNMGSLFFIEIKHSADDVFRRAEYARLYPYPP